MPSLVPPPHVVQRLADVRAAMKAHNVDGLVVTHLPSIRYLFGFSGSMATAIITRRKVLFVTNDLYDVQVRNEVYPLDGLSIAINRDTWGAIASSGICRTVKNMGFEPGRITVAGLKAIRKAVAPAKCVEVPSLIEPITRVKSASEIKSIAKAAAIVSTAYERMLSAVRPGDREVDVANYLATVTRELGSQKDAFDIIVVGGQRSAMPHGRASTAKLKKGDVVTVDFGACVDGLHSDMTRTFCIGKPSKKIFEVFSVLYEAHLAALDAATAGIGAAQLDAAARDVITKAGYGDYFRHSLGHGLGYEVHEWPRISYANKTETIPANCVITIEPGIYLPGEFGMRIEDDVVVTTGAASILTTAPRELVVV